MLLLLFLMVPCLAAYELVTWLWCDSLPGKAGLILRAALAAGIGLGLASMLFFMNLVLFGSMNILSPWSEISVMLVIGLLARAGRQRRMVQPDLRKEGQPWPPGTTFSKALNGIFVAAISIAAFKFLYSGMSMPHGVWDGWAIWNLRARFLAGEHWADAFSQLMNWSHPDYPLLLPATVARLWRLLESQSTWVPFLVAMFFTFGTITVAVAALTLIRGRVQGVLAGLVLVLGTQLLQQGAWQIADVPLAFYILASMAVLAVGDHSGKEALGMHALAGLLAGCAAWTKNEGCLFVLCLVSCRLLLGMVGEGWKQCLRKLLCFAAGFAPLAVGLLIFKLHFAPTNDLVHGQGWGVSVGKLVDFSRYALIAEWMATTAWKTGGVALVGSLLVIHLLAMTKCGLRRLSDGAPVVLTVLMLEGYFVVYVVTPNPLEWHLGSSVNRLLMHLTPLAIFGIFNCVNLPMVAPITLTKMESPQRAAA